MTVCSICGQDKPDGDNNNASPITRGRCCDECNQEHVLPARIEHKQTMTKQVFEELREMQSSPEKKKEKEDEIMEWMLGFQKRLAIAEHLSMYADDELERKFYADYIGWHAKMMERLTDAGEDSKPAMVDMWEDYMVELRDKFFKLMGSNEKIDELLDKIKDLAQNAEQGDFGACKFIGSDEKVLSLQVADQ